MKKEMIEVEVELSIEIIAEIALLAHEKNITFNEMCNIILKEGIKKEKIMSKKEFKNPVCVICKKKIEGVYLKDEYGMIDRGILSSIYAGYGSKYDGLVFQVGICDGCITKLLKEHKIKVLSDYLFNDISEDELKELNNENIEEE